MFASSRLFIVALVTAVAFISSVAHGFTVGPTTTTAVSSRCKSSSTELGIFKKIGEMFEELDNFMDDATARRLGAGSAFYGKRKSSFYGKDDKGRKRDPGMPDPSEDFQGPASGGLYKWIQNDEGRMVPVSRRRNTPLERNPKFWDRFYEQQAEEGTKDTVTKK